MKRIPILTTLLLSLLALAACQKTDDAAPDGMVEIFAESMNGGDKVALDGLSAIWRSGDEIRINGSTATVKRRGDHAYISNASISEGTNRALYPASLSTVNWGTDNPVVTLPAYYHYRTDGSGHQVLDLPMAAYSNSRTSPLQFKHLTGALYVTVKNTSANPRTLQSVTVKSNLYALNGTLRVALNTPGLVEASTTEAAAERAVTLVFDKVVTLANGESVRVMIPVRPVRSDNNFTIEVKSYASGQQSSYLSSRTQTSGSDHSLARNELGYAPMDIPVDAETTVPVLTLNADKYEIYTPYDFKLMTEAIRGNWFSNNSAKYYIMEDIDMTDISITTINNDLFGGWIIGNNHTVSNLTINGIQDVNNAYCGLFKLLRPQAVIQNITFENLSLANENVDSKTLYVGAIEAYNGSASSMVTISDCSVNIGSFSDGGAGDVYFGGLIGCLESSVEVRISNCHVSTSNLGVGGKNIWWGGLVGNITNSKLYISSSSWRGEGNTTIDATTNVKVGGLVGQKGLSPITITSDTVSGRMVVSAGGSTRWVGSFIGFHSQYASDTFSGDTCTVGFSASLNRVEVQPIKKIGNGSN